MPGMGIRILGGVLVNEEERVGACLYQSTNMQAFGPIFPDVETAEAFLEWFYKEHGTTSQADYYLCEQARRIYQEEYLPFLRLKEGASRAMS